MSIKTHDLEQIIQTHALINQPVFIFGRPGIGKTQEITRIGKNYYEHYFHMDGSQMPYESIQGINYVNENKMKNTPYPVIKELEDLATGKAKLNGKVFVFIDEVSSLAQDDQRTLLNIINDRITPNGIKLTYDIMFVLAGNPASDQKGFSSDNSNASVNLVEQAIVTRCATYKLTYTVADYIRYANNVGIHQSIIKTLKDVPELFDQYNDDSHDSVQVIVPRTLNMLSDLIYASMENNKELTEAMFEAFTGDSAPLFYQNYIDSNKININVKDLFEGSKKEFDKYKTLTTSEQGSLIIRGIRQAFLVDNIPLNNENNDKTLKKLVESLNPEYCLTIAEMMKQPELIKHYLGHETNRHLASVIATARA